MARPWLLFALVPCVAQDPEGPGFADEAILRGVDYVDHLGYPDIAFGTGLAFADLDQDGDADLVTLGRYDGRVGVFENDGDGFFADRSGTCGIPPVLEPSGVTAADYDGDRDLDLYLTCSVAPNLLFRNDGDLRFTDVTAAAGVGDDGAGMGSAWADFDQDGWLDLYVANRYSTLGSTNPSRLYKNQGDGTFVDVAADLGVAFAGHYTFQPVFFDLEKDGDPDLYLSNDKGYLPQIQNHLLENVGGTFVDITSNSGTAANFDSMGVAAGDFDRNGLLDLYATNTAPGNALFLQLAPGQFVNATAAAGVGSFATGWGALFLDHENDGYSALYVCNVDRPNRLYVHTGQWPCIDLAPVLGVSDPRPSFGAASADIDRDGDVDLAVSNWEWNVGLFANRHAGASSWVELRVSGEAPNHHAVGATVDVRTGTVWQTGQVLAGGSYKSQSDLVLHFGLGGATAVDEIRTRWPGSGTRTVRNLRVREVWTLVPDAQLGDGDRDGDVDARDLHALLKCWTGSGPGLVDPGCEAMDLDGDGDVDQADLGLFLERYGSPSPAGPAGHLRR